MTNPDYIGAVIGLSNDNKLVYDYDKMVEILAKEYSEAQEDIGDPYEAAVEWIDYNCDIPYWTIVYTTSDGDYDITIESEEALNVVDQFKDAFVGLSTHGVLLFDEEKLTENEMDSIADKLKDDYPDIEFI